LEDADLTSAHATWADFSGANLTRTKLHNAELHHIQLIDTQLHPNILDAGVTGTKVDWRTVARSLQMDGLLKFLVGTGMPNPVALALIASTRSIDKESLSAMLHSVFISYGRPDAAFAQRLSAALTRNGVQTWFFPADAVPGKRLHRHLQTQIYSHDRVILCASEASLQRDGVLHEIEEALEREQDEGGSEIVIPILLGPIFDTGRNAPPWWPADKEHVYVSLRKRVAADFRGAMQSEELWTEQLSRLLIALREIPVGPSAKITGETSGG
jgi:hypothetical protein